MKLQELLNLDYILSYILKSLFSAIKFSSSLFQPFAFFLYEIVITRSSFKNRFLCLLDVACAFLTAYWTFTPGCIIGFDFQYSELLSPQTIKISQKTQHVHVQIISCRLPLKHTKKHKA